jgi:transcriptional regulator with XRE-family HTH domain
MAKKVGQSIKLFRVRKRLTQNDVVEKLSDFFPINQTMISRIENGEVWPDKQQTAAICKVLECNADDIWNEAEALKALRESLEEAIVDDNSNGTNSSKAVNQLLDCLHHEKFAIPNETMTIMRAYLAGDDAKMVEQLAVLEELALEGNGYDDLADRLPEIRSIANSNFITQRSFNRLVDLFEMVLRRLKDEAVA